MPSLQVLALCKQSRIPVAVVLINGGAVAIDPLVPAAPAIVEAFYPSVRGAEALALALFGVENRWGRLPITMYDKSFMQVDFHNFDMAKAPGRTYKYYQRPALFKFGTGISYSQFTTSCTMASTATDVGIVITCTLRISGGAKRGDEVLMAYHSVGPAIRTAALLKHSVPIKELVAFERVSLAGDSSAKVQLYIGPQQLGLVDETGTKQLAAGAHTITVTNGGSFSKTFPVQVSASKVLITVPPMPEQL